MGLGGAAMAAALGGCVAPAPQARQDPPPPPHCAIGTEMTGVTFYFGENGRNGHLAVTPSKWTDFARLVLTPAFPRGFTVTAGRGQWLSSRTGTMAEEPTRIVRADLPASESVQERIARVRAAYQEAYEQDAVGVEIGTFCADFSGARPDAAASP